MAEKTTKNATTATSEEKVVRKPRATKAATKKNQEQLETISQDTTTETVEEAAVVEKKKTRTARRRERTVSGFSVGDVGDTSKNDEPKKEPTFKKAEAQNRKKIAKEKAEKKARESNQETSIANIPEEIIKKDVEVDADYNRDDFMEETRKSAVRRSERSKKHSEQTMVNARINEVMRKGQTVYGTVLGYASVPSLGVCALVMYHENIRVYIPFGDMFIDKMKVAPNETTEQIAIRQNQLISRTTGANIQFIITNYITDKENDENYIVVGNRKKAMLKAQAKYYEPLGTEDAQIKEGSIVDSEIIGVGLHGVRVCVRGVDSQISVMNLSYRPLGNLRDEYAPGQILPVCVRSVKRNEDTGNIEVSVESKSLELADYEKRVKTVPMGSVLMARIVKIYSGERGGSLTSNKPSATLFVDGFNVPAFSNAIKTDGMSVPLCQGDTVLFRADGIYKNGCILLGTIVRQLTTSEGSSRYGNNKRVAR